jgi:hypothetical protein
MSAEVKAAVMARMPAPVVDLLREIETRAGREVTFAPMRHPPSPNDPNPDAPGCEVSGSFARLVYRDPDTLSENGITHELLHIRRYWVDGVPQVHPVQGDDDKWSVTSAIENAIEHLVVVPEEAKYCAIDPDYWNRTSATNWSSYPWPDVPSEWVRRKHLILGRLGLELVTDRDVKAHVEQCLKAAGVWGEAQRVARAVRENVLRRKDLAVRTVVGALRIPRNEVRLVYLDPHKGTERFEPLPA